MNDGFVLRSDQDCFGPTLGQEARPIVNLRSLDADRIVVEGGLAPPLWARGRICATSSSDRPVAVPCEGEPIDLCQFVVGRTFASESVSPPAPPIFAGGSDSLRFDGLDAANLELGSAANLHAGTYTLTHTDFEEPGTFTCVDGQIEAQSGSGPGSMQRNGSFDPVSGTLTWQGNQFRAPRFDVSVPCGPDAGLVTDLPDPSFLASIAGVYHAQFADPPGVNLVLGANGSVLQESVPQSEQETGTVVQVNGAHYVHIDALTCRPEGWSLYGTCVRVIENVDDQHIRVGGSLWTRGRVCPSCPGTPENPSAGPMVVSCPDDAPNGPCPPQ